MYASAVKFEKGLLGDLKIKHEFVRKIFNFRGVLLEIPGDLTGMIYIWSTMFLSAAYRASKGVNKMTAIFQMILWSKFSWKEMFVLT